MRKYRYLVVLESMQTKVKTFTEQEAVILAQAEAIKLDLNYTLVSVVRITE